MKISSSDYIIEHCFLSHLDNGHHYYQAVKINYIIEGKIKYIIEDHEMIIERGDIYLINENVFHEAIIIEDVEMISLTINHRFLSMMMNYKHFDFTIKNNPPIKELVPILLEMYNYHQKERMLETYLLLLKLIKLLKEETQMISNDLFSSNVFLFIQQYIERHYQSHITLEALAKLTNYNESYLSTRFKKTFGIGINEYLRNIRMEHVLTDLLISDKRILDVAFQNGFESIQSFNRLFKKLYDQTPKDYREKNRELVCLF